jgi:hypothetical protein
VPTKQLRGASVICAVMFLVGIPAMTVDAETVDHAPFDTLLQAHVYDGLVDYAGLQGDAHSLRAYMASISSIAVSQLASREEVLAFWINTYNATVLTAVLSYYPLSSVKNVKGFFTERRYAIAGEQLTLNEIESRGRALGDWRIHCVLVCASSSCPTLRNQAYTSAQLDEQLDEQTRAFLASPDRGVRIDGMTLWVSRIFKWYVDDFIPSSGWFVRVNAESLLAVLEPYLTPELRALQLGRPLHLRFMPYDWSLNAIPSE